MTSVPWEVLTRQLLISGRITDAVTGVRTRALPVVEVLRESDRRGVGDVHVRVSADGGFAVSGDPQRMLPPQDTEIRLEVSATGYARVSALEVFTTADLARVPRSLVVAGRTHEALVIDAQPRSRDVVLPPLPVTVVGRVARAEDPSRAIPGATVAITAPGTAGPVLTDDEGYFTLGPAPVAASVTLSISAPGRVTATPAVRLDHARPVNHGAFTLQLI